MDDPSESAIDTGNESGVTIYWFRNALRLHDNPSFFSACDKANSDYLLPIYIIDPDYPFAQSDNVRTGIVRANFCLESISNLQRDTQKLNSRIIFLQGKAEIILPKICSQLKATKLMFESDPATPVKERDKKIVAAVKKETDDKIEVIQFDTYSLFGMNKYLSQCNNKIVPQTYTAFRKLFDRMGEAPKEVKHIVEIPPLPINYLEQIRVLLDSNKQEEYEIPSLKDLGYTNRLEATQKYSGGEKAALEALDRMVLQREKWVIEFGKKKTSPTLKCEGTGLSPYVKHGCLSPRRLYHAFLKIYSKQPGFNEPSDSLRNRMMMREYDFLLGYSTPNFDKMVGNPKAIQIDWGEPNYKEDSSPINKWKNGQTGYPFIDAIMTELKVTGWISHVARDAVARFLTRGDLWQHWEAGASYFEEALIDADWSVNNFNWQKSSCTSHDPKYSKCTSPISLGKKLDKNGEYIRQWIPCFQNFPTKFIFEPWTAPRAIQEERGIVIGVDYPLPIVDHSIVRLENLDKMKQAYDEKRSAKKMRI